MSPAEKQKRYRQRQRRRLVVLQVTVPHDKFVYALLDSTRLSPADALDRKKLGLAAGDVLVDWARKWRESSYR
jgi:hypothetical protein